MVTTGADVCLLDVLAVHCSVFTEISYVHCLAGEMMSGLLCLLSSLNETLVRLAFVSHQHPQKPNPGIMNSCAQEAMGISASCHAESQESYPVSRRSD